MTVIYSSSIRSSLKKICPHLKFVVLSDPEWTLPSLKDLNLFLEKQWFPAMPPFINRVCECEEHAIMLMAEQRRWHANTISLGKMQLGPNWPLGICVGTKFRGQEINHWLNICLTKEGLRMIEPQTRRDNVWEPSLGQDNFYFLLM